MVKSNLGDLVSLALDFPPSILGHFDPLFKITVFSCLYQSTRCTSRCRNSFLSSLNVPVLFPQTLETNFDRDIIFETILTRWLKEAIENCNFDPWAKLEENYQRWKFLSGEISYVTWNLGDDRREEISIREFQCSTKNTVWRSFLLSSEKSRILFHDLVKEMGLLLSSPRLGGSQEI